MSQHNFKPKNETIIPTGFSLQTHFRDGVGRLLATRPYRLFITKVGSGGESTELYEQPKHSGNLWYKSGEPAGRVVFNDKKEPQFKLGEAHQEWTPPLTGAEKIYADLKAAEEQNAALAAELAAIKKEQQTKAAEKQAKVMVEKATKES